MLVPAEVVSSSASPSWGTNGCTSCCPGTKIPSGIRPWPHRPTPHPTSSSPPAPPERTSRPAVLAGCVPFRPHTLGPVQFDGQEVPHPVKTRHYPVHLKVPTRLDTNFGAHALGSWKSYLQPTANKAQMLQSSDLQCNRLGNLQVCNAES